MTHNGYREPLQAGGYGGFSAPDAPRARARPELEIHPARIPTPVARDYHGAPARGRRPLGLVMGGVLAAAVLGIAFGFLGRPQLGQPAKPMPPAAAPGADALTDAPTVAAPAAPAAVSVETPAPPPVARQVTVAVAPEPAAPQPVRRPAPPPRPEPVVIAAPEPPIARPSFNCAYARSRSERMVCGDPQLARLDRRLNRAFAAAVDAGVPRRPLRALQDRWIVGEREAAAHRSPDALADAYRRRIAELEDLARGG